MDKKISLSSHILDLNTGRPAQGVTLKLFKLVNNSWVNFGEHGVTDENGRYKNFANIDDFGTFKLTFLTKEYFERFGINQTLYPYIEIIFDIKSLEHYHIPLLLSPFGYSTYRGS